MAEVRYDVVVAGAGVSGLACAAALHEAGATVAVLEARRRVGGRLLSIPVDGPDPDAALDLGATWFWPHQPLLAAAATRLGIGTFAQYTAGDALLESLSTDGTPVSRRIPDNPIDVDAGRFRAGAQSLARSLAAQLPGGAVRLGSPVETIRATGHGLLVRAGHHELSGDHVVVALPPALAVTTIDITPALPRSLVALARTTPTWMAGTAKVIARYRRAFWREQGLAGAAISHAGPLREIHDMSGAGGEPAALFGFAAATAPPDPMLGDRARAQLARLFGAEAGDPVELHVLDWSAEPYTCPPGPQTGNAHHLLGHHGYQEPALDGRLHWAGTETSSAHAGHIEGALDAAARASDAVLSRRPVGRLHG